MLTRSFTPAPALVALLLACMLLAGCAAPAPLEPPDEEPYARGRVAEITHGPSRSRVLVEALPGSREPCGIAAGVDEETRYLRREAGTFRPSMLAELSVGDTVEVWVKGAVAESCPPQGYASTIVVLGVAAGR